MPHDASPAIQDLFAQALQLHQAGQLAEADRLCERILQIDSSHGDAAHLRGFIALQLGQREAAVALIERAIAIKPNDAFYRYNLGNAFYGLSRIEEAAGAYAAAARLRPDLAEAHCNLGNALKDLGRLDEAIAACRHAVRLKPSLAEAHANLGLALHKSGRFHDAIAAYQAALAIRPNLAEVHSNLGNTLRSLGRLDEAVASYTASLRISPGRAETHSNLGNVLYDLERFDEAIAAYAAALRIKPLAEIHCNVGNALKALGRLEESVVSYKTALRNKPDYAEAYLSLGTALHDMGLFEDACAAYETALRLKPDFAKVHLNLGNTLQRLGRTEDAIAAYNHAIAASPDYAEPHYNLGAALQSLGRLDAAAAAYTTAISLKPDFVEAHSNLGSALCALGRLGEALGACDAALRIDPERVEVHVNRGLALTAAGRHEEAVAALNTALHIDPDYATAHSSLLHILHYMAGVDRRTMLATARRFAARVEGKVAPEFSRSADPDRRLRIGYVSGDFRRHPVGWFLERILANHDHGAMEVYCYSNHPGADPMTARLRGAADHWRNIVGLSDEAAAALIAADGIDILIDLSGHTALNRLLVFARKPAPVQVTWLGFWGTTGLSTMDYILSDPVTIPPGEEDDYSERVVRLPEVRFCYGPPDYAPAPSPPPSLRGGGPTFGSFNNLAKIGPEVVELWAKVLHAVPDARLLLKWQSMNDPDVRRRITDAFAAAGIAAQRLVLRGASKHPEMLAEYGDIDVALDPFPFAGGLTSCEALWMGVPIVTLPGATAPSRQTRGLLNVLGLTRWVADSPASYVRIAADLAADVAQRNALRFEIRRLMQASILCDGVRFTRQLEGVYRELWRSWCTDRTTPAHRR